MPWLDPLTRDHPLVSFWKSRRSPPGLVGVTLYPSGVALARVERVAGQPPALTACDYERGNLHGVLLKRLVRRHQLENSRCVLCLHSSQYVHGMIDRPEVEVDELQDALRWRVGDLIDYPVSEALIDSYEVAKGTTDHDANQLGIVIVKRSVVEELYQTLNQAGLKPVAIDVIEFCQRNIGELLPENDRGLLLLQLRHTSTQMLGIQKGQLLISRQTNILGDEVNDELESLAEGDHLAGEKASVENLTVEVQRTINFYSSRARRPPPTGLILMPFQGDLPGLTSHLTQMAGIPARSLDLNMVLDTREPLDNALQAAASDAVGAALRSEEETTA